MRPLIKRNRQKVDKKEKSVKLSSTLYFSKTIIFSYESHQQQKQINKKVSLFTQRKRLRPEIIQSTPYVSKGTSNIDKNQKVYNFLRKTRVEASKFITNS